MSKAELAPLVPESKRRFLSDPSWTPQSRRAVIAAANVFFVSVLALIVYTSQGGKTESAPDALVGGQETGSLDVGAVGEVPPHPYDEAKDLSSGIREDETETVDAGPPLPPMDLDTPQAKAEEARVEAVLEKLECNSRRKERPGLDRGVRVIYVHVPKTGGTSIQAAVERWVTAVSFNSAARKQDAVQRN